MPRRLITSGSPFERAVGYSRAVVQGDWCFVAGTTGYDPATREMPPAAADHKRLIGFGETAPDARCPRMA